MVRTILVTLLLLMIGCGGGTGGTGGSDNRVVQGSVLTTQSTPIEGVTITDIESGDTAVTDANGAFSIPVESDGNSVNFELQSEGITYTLPLDGLQGSRIDVTIELDEATQTATARNIDVRAKIVGVCDIAFENRAIIRQSNRLENGTVCPIEVRVVSSGGPIQGSAFVMEHRKCKSNAPWNRDTAGTTDLDGYGQSSFTYYNDNDHCEYRIIVADSSEGLSPVVFPVHTFRFQARE